MKTISTVNKDALIKDLVQYYLKNSELITDKTRRKSIFDWMVRQCIAIKESESFDVAMPVFDGALNRLDEEFS